MNIHRHQETSVIFNNLQNILCLRLIQTSNQYEYYLHRKLELRYLNLKTNEETMVREVVRPVVRSLVSCVVARVR